MGVNDFQYFIEDTCKGACKSVDLIKLARGLALSQAGKHRGPNRLCLIVDGESCLDRLYGGYYSDWACGGQWNRMNQFLHTLIQACGSAHMELLVFFNGGLENQRLTEWFKQQETIKKNASNVLKHINNKATPPPKVWWIPPVTLHSSLRMALRQYGVPVASSLEDHHQEIMQYLRENNFHGVIADEADYAIFNPPRYFSSQHLKLTYKGALETIEFDMDEVAKLLDLHPKRFCIAAALLGNHLLSESELESFYLKICMISDVTEFRKLKPNYVMNKVIEFVRVLQNVEDLDTVAKEVFGFQNVRSTKFKHSVHYYMNGTTDHFGKYKKELRAQIRQSNNKFGQVNPVHTENIKEAAVMKKSIEDWDGPKPKRKEGNLKANHFLEHESGYANTVTESGATADADSPIDDIEDTESRAIDLNTNEKNNEKCIEDAESGAVDLNRVSEKGEKKLKSMHKPFKISQDAVKIAKDRHQKGYMHPWVYQILAHTEVKIDSSLEDETNCDLPLAVDLYRPVRQLVYSILFDYNKRMLIYRNAIKEGKESGQEKPKAIVREWSLPRGNINKPKCDDVSAEELDWLVPGLHRLWLGQENVDKNRRLRAFLSCLNSDVPLMLNTTYIPQHLIVLCAVLRYMVLFKDQRVLRKPELDAYLATAVSPLLCDVDTMQEMKLPLLTSRGVQLGTLFMRGVEHAIFVNDSCGAPVPWGMCCPWLFFDGKLFHFKLLKANNNTPLIDICDGQVDQVMRVERMRQAILQGVPLDLVFAKPPLPPMQSQFAAHSQTYGMNVPHNRAQRPLVLQGCGSSGRGRGNIGGIGQVDQRGGQLQIAGVVVGNWGPNMNASKDCSGGRSNYVTPPPQVTSVGPRRGGQRGVVSSAASRGRGYSRSAVPLVRGGGRDQVHRMNFYNGLQHHNNLRSSGGAGRGNANINRHTGAENRYIVNNGNRYNIIANRFIGSGDNGNHNRGYHHQYNHQNYGNAHVNFIGNNGNRSSDINRVSMAERARSSGVGRGRGCTVESQKDGGKIVSVSQLIKTDVPTQVPPQSQASVVAPIAQVPTVTASEQMISQQRPIQQPAPHQLAPQISTSGGHNAPQVNLGHAGNMSAVTIHGGGPPQMTHMNLGQGHLNVGSITTMGQVSQITSINITGQGHMPHIGLNGPQMLNGSGDFGGTFQGIHHNELGVIGQNELNMIGGQVSDFPVMDSHIGMFHDTE